eukprot:8680652-Karenia_brevis.AAC.1
MFCDHPESAGWGSSSQHHPVFVVMRPWQKPPSQHHPVIQDSRQQNRIFSASADAGLLQPNYHPRPWDG